MNTEEEPTELRQFREQWKEEVRLRREEQHVHQQGASSEPNQHKASSPARNSQSHAHPRLTPLDTAVKSPLTWSAPRQTPHTSHGQSPLSGSIARAVEIYRRAVQREQESDLDEALGLYRQAFRLNPDVDRAYFKEEERLKQLGRSAIGISHKKTTSAGKGEGTETKDSRATRATEGNTSKESVHANTLCFPEVLSFEPEDEREGVPINMIPEELLLCILRNLDTTTLERFAAVSRKARILSLDPSIWRYGYPLSQTTNATVTVFNDRDFVYMAYKPPQIPETVTVETIVDEYNSNYRQTYIEHPRLRLDGVYIAVCHYV